MQVLVRENNVDQALRVLKKKMQREGIFREMKLRNHYEKPSERRAREKAEAIRRARKLARKRAQREGLIPQKSPAAIAKMRSEMRAAKADPAWKPVQEEICKDLRIKFNDYLEEVLSRSG